MNIDEAGLHHDSEQHFDIIALTGDLADRYNPILDANADLLADLTNSEIYYLRGKHDFWLIGLPLLLKDT